MGGVVGVGRFYRRGQRTTHDGPADCVVDEPINRQARIGRHVQERCIVGRGNRERVGDGAIVVRVSGHGVTACRVGHQFTVSGACAECFTMCQG